MASKYGGKPTRKKVYTPRKKKDSETEPNLIPIYFRLPDHSQVDLITGYLEERPYEVADEKRFYGYFICESCKKRDVWTSGYAWQGYRQECKKCRVLSWPYMVYHLEKSKDKDKKFEKPHKSDLCEKCQKYGVHCLTKLPLKPDTEQAHPVNPHASDDVEDENEFTVYFAKQYKLDRNLIKIEPEYIWNLFDSLWDILSRENKAEFKEALEKALQHWEKKRRDDVVSVCKDVKNKICYY